MDTVTTLGCNLSRSFKESIYSFMISRLDYGNCLLLDPLLSLSTFCKLSKCHWSSHLSLIMLFTHNLSKLIYKDLLYWCKRSSEFGTFLIVSIQVFGISRLHFHIHWVFKILWFSFTSMLKWEPKPYKMSQGRTFSPVCQSNHNVSSVVCSFLHGHPFSYLCYFTFVPSSLLCLLCSISYWLKYLCSCHFHFPLSLCFCKACKCQLVSATDSNSQIPVFSLYLFLGCKVLHSSEVLWAALSKTSSCFVFFFKDL